MATIKPIEGHSVHQIQSGQVIVDLCSVAKELVENSIDAGATSIEVRFKNNGLDAIEVQDNGGGIAPADYDTIALKHYTSKLSSYDDLTSLTTFGFRGEALSSLCALSNFHIITARASEGPKGTRLDFETSGKLKGTSVVAAKQGTTVVVQNLFYNLPVRRKELEKTVKREYNKVLSLLNAYACISTGIKFSVSNLVSKGKKTVAFATQSNPNTKENIANVYGTKTLLALIPLNLKFELEPSSTSGLSSTARARTAQEEDPRSIRIVGHISRPVVGEGRQTPDRQMFFVNSRPCLLPQVAKAFNEVYKSYNITQSPFIFADIKLDTNAYDVNVSPDKRTILLHDQTVLLENLKTALVELFEAHDQSVPRAQPLGSSKTLPFTPPSFQKRLSTASNNGDQTGPMLDKTSHIGTALQPEPEAPESPVSSPEERHRDFVKASLIDRFSSGDTEDRAHSRSTKFQDRTSAKKHDAPASLEEQRDEDSIAIDEPERDSSAEIPPAEELRRPVQDFNAVIAAHHARQLAQNLSPETTKSDDEEDGEDAIPAIKQTPQTRTSQSTVQNAFDRMRPLRTPAQQATITIGDTTTVSTIGGSSRASKRANIHVPKFSLNGTLLSQTPKKPLFMKSLRGFVAPGTQVDDSDEGEEEQQNGESGSDTSVRDVHTDRSPSLEKGVVSEGTVGTPPDGFHDNQSITLAAASSPTLESSGLDSQSEPQDENGDDEESDEEFVDEAESRAREEARIAKAMAKAEEAAARPTEVNLKRATKLLQFSKKKPSTLGLVLPIETSAAAISRHFQALETCLRKSAVERDGDVPTDDGLNTSDPEERLSLTVMKSHFGNMHIVGQFNLGFILTLRPPTPASPTPDLFIIDQHASDEKYNFERLSSSTVVAPQPLALPHLLELTAVEEEVILNNEDALIANGFRVSVDTSGDSAVGQRAKLTSIPMSKEYTFRTTDLEELLALLQDNPPASAGSKYIPRPSKVRKLLASRACRSSIMIGKTLKTAQMERVVRHMGEMDKPWSCPHGRPTMRHLFGLENWEGWREGDGIAGLGEVGGKTDWSGYLDSRNRSKRL